MTLKIDLTKRLTADELRYLVDRDRWEDLRENARNLGIEEPNLPSARGIRAQVPRRQLRNTDAFDSIAKQMGIKLRKEDEEPSSVSTPQPTSESDARVNYEKLTVPQLKEEMDKRREQYAGEEDGEGVELMTYASDAKKSDLVAALALDDQGEDEGE
jgi:hypothetical protein